MKKTLSIPNAVDPIEIDTDDYEENEIKEMEKSLKKYWIGQLLGLVRKSEDISFDGTLFLLHKLKADLFDGNENRAYQNY